MRYRLPSSIETAKGEAENYRVRPAERGFNIWRYRDWGRRESGWRIIDTGPTREECWVRVLVRLGLAIEEPKPPAPVEPMFFFDIYG